MTTRREFLKTFALLAPVAIVAPGPVTAALLVAAPVALCITPLPLPPSPADTPGEFAHKADAFMAALPEIVEQINKTSRGWNEA